MMQIIASANSVYDIPWPQSFSGLLDVLKVFLVDFITITRTNCAARLNYYQSLLLTLLLFKVSSVAGVLFPVSRGHAHSLHAYGVFVVQWGMYITEVSRTSFSLPRTLSINSPTITRHSSLSCSPLGEIMGVWHCGSRTHLRLFASVLLDVHRRW